MPDRDARLIELAAALSDGTPIDWEAAESMAASDSERQQIRRMRLVRDVAEGHPGASIANDTNALHESLLHPNGETPSGDETSQTVPVTWGPLRVIEKIGHGRFGDVYRAWDPRLDREVALKLLRRRTAERDELGSSVIEEGRLLAKVRHDNVVTVHGAERIDERVGVWMELVRGRTLEEELIARGPFPPDEVAAIGADVCRALAAVHRAGLLHRDVKAQNVMREADGRVVLMDFGTGLESADSADATALAGTPLYLAPEVIQGGTATVQSDLYSVGVLLHRLATGDFPIEGQTLRDVRREHSEGEQRRLAESRPDLPRNLTRVIDRALYPLPSDRFADAAAMAAALDAGKPGPGPVFKRRPALIALSAVISLVLAGGIWIGSTVRRSGPPVPFAARDWVLVTSFDNRTGEPLLDSTLEGAFERELGASSYVNVVPRERVNDALLLMRRPTDTRIDEAVGRAVAERDGAVRALIGGRVDKGANGYILTASIIAPASGSVAATLTEQARNESELQPAVARAALKMREMLGEALTSIAASRTEREKVTTPLMRALQHYSQGSLLFSQARSLVPGSTQLQGAAEQLLRAAITEDAEFASAYMLLALTVQIRSLSDAVNYADRAFALKDRTTEVERLFITGTYYKLHAVTATNPTEKTQLFQRAANVYESLLRLQPDHYWALDRLAETYRSMNRSPDEIRTLLRLAAVRPNSLFWQIRAAQSAFRNGNFAEARRLTTDTPRLLTPADLETNTNALWARLFPAYYAWLENDAAKAVQEMDNFAREIPALTQASPYAVRRNVVGPTYCMYLSLGRLDQADAVLQSLPERDEWRYQGAVKVAFARKDIAGLRQVLSRGNPEHHMRVPMQLIEAGMFAAARRAIPQVAPAFRPLYEGQLALATGRLDEAIRVLTAHMDANRDPNTTVMGSRQLAIAWRAKGDLARAIDVLERASEAFPRAIWVGGGWSQAYEWIELRARLADLYSEANRPADGQVIDRELLQLLAVADDDHPIKVKLLQRASAGRQ